MNVHKTIGNTNSFFYKCNYFEKDAQNGGLGVCLNRYLGFKNGVHIQWYTNRVKNKKYVAIKTAII